MFTRKLVLALALAAVAGPALAQTPGTIVMPTVTPAIVNTTQPPPPPPAEAPKTDDAQKPKTN
jgi:hypothetical protein